MSTVAAWMSSPVHTVTPGTRASEAVGILRRQAVRHLPVMEGDRVVGVVTDRDLRGTEPDAAVGGIMSRPATVVGPRTSIDRAARLLFDRRIGCLPVLEDGRLVGILTQTDALAALVSILREQVGGRHAEVVVGFRPDAMAIARQALRPFGVEVARLVAATREPFGPGVPSERVRLEIETRDMDRVREALAAAGLTVIEDREP